MIRSNILGLSTAFVSWHAVGDEEAMEWADSAGGARAALESMGAVTGLENTPRNEKSFLLSFQARATSLRGLFLCSLP